MLRHYKVKPFLVFDGGPLPMKSGTESDRRSKREANMLEGKKLWKEGRKSKAIEFFQKCVDVTPEMASQLIQALKSEGIDYIVAPYEADAQLAYLDKHNIVQGVITEDSDLLVFGCKRVIFKLDNFGEGLCINREDFVNNKDASFVGWTDAMFRQMAILSGCDYLSSISGFGLKTAHRYMKRKGNASKVIRDARFRGMKVPKDYEENFKKAELTFLHQRVFDPNTETLVPLTPLPDSSECNIIDWEFIGSDLDVEVAKKIAKGELCPITKEPMTDTTFIQTQKNFERTPKKSLSRPIKNHSITSFFGAVSSPSSLEILKEAQKRSNSDSSLNYEDKKYVDENCRPSVNSSTGSPKVSKHHTVDVKPVIPTISRFFANSCQKKNQMKNHHTNESSTTRHLNHSKNSSLEDPGTGSQRRLSDSNEASVGAEDNEKTIEAKLDIECCQKSDVADDKIIEYSCSQNQSSQTSVYTIILDDSSDSNSDVDDSFVSKPKNNEVVTLNTHQDDSDLEKVGQSADVQIESQVEKDNPLNDKQKIRMNQINPYHSDWNKENIPPGTILNGCSPTAEQLSVRRDGGQGGRNIEEITPMTPFDHSDHSVIERKPKTKKSNTSALGKTLKERFSFMDSDCNVLKWSANTFQSKGSVSEPSTQSFSQPTFRVSQGHEISRFTAEKSGPLKRSQSSFSLFHRGDFTMNKKSRKSMPVPVPVFRFSSENQTCGNMNRSFSFPSPNGSPPFSFSSNKSLRKRSLPLHERSENMLPLESLT